MLMILLLYCAEPAQMTGAEDDGYGILKCDPHIREEQLVVMWPQNPAQ